MEFLYGIDKAVFLFFNAQLTHPVLDVAMPFITEFRNWIVLGILGAAMFVWREKKKALIVLGLGALAVALSDPLIAKFLKEAVARPRPCHPDFLVEGGRFLLGQRASIKSFPSSHTMNMFAVATILFCFYPRLWMYFFPFAALIGYTRVYCGVHYPSDVLGGAVLGCLVGWGVYAGYRAIAKKAGSSRKGFDGGQSGGAVSVGDDSQKDS